MGYAKTMHNYLSVMLGELVMLVLQSEREALPTMLSHLVGRVVAEVAVLALHWVTDHQFDRVVQDR